MKLIKSFKVVPDGEIYPIELLAGDECPAEYEATALALGAAVVEKSTRKAKADNGNPDA